MDQEVCFSFSLSFHLYCDRVYYAFIKSMPPLWFVIKLLPQPHSSLQLSPGERAGTEKERPESHTTSAAPPVVRIQETCETCHVCTCSVTQDECLQYP